MLVKKRRRGDRKRWREMERERERERERARGQGSDSGRYRVCKIMINYHFPSQVTAVQSSGQSTASQWPCWVIHVHVQIVCVCVGGNVN